jgi:hypothetical protein
LDHAREGWIKPGRRAKKNRPDPGRQRGASVRYPAPGPNESRTSNGLHVYVTDLLPPPLNAWQSHVPVKTPTRSAQCVAPASFHHRVRPHRIARLARVAGRGHITANSPRTGHAKDARPHTDSMEAARDLRSLPWDLYASGRGLSRTWREVFLPTARTVRLGELYARLGALDGPKIKPCKGCAARTRGKSAGRGWKVAHFSRSAAQREPVEGRAVPESRVRHTLAP